MTDSYLEPNELSATEAQQRAKELTKQYSAHDTAHALGLERANVSSSILSNTDPETAAEIIEQISQVQATQLLENLDPETAAKIITELPSDKRADFIHELTPADADQILEHMPVATADETRALASYPGNVAGGLMVTEFFRFQAQASVSEVVADFRKNAERYRNYVIQYIYVVNTDAQLIGVVPLRTLLWAEREQRMNELMLTELVSVTEHTNIEQLDSLFMRYNFFGLPVLDSKGRLVGVVRRVSLEEALVERRESEYRKTQGIVGGDEIRSMPLYLRSSRRLSWLTINIFLNLVAASVIAAHQETLAQVLALAIFLPIISDMSGCSGNQAVAVSMRELALGLVRPTEIIRVLNKELLLGIINGLALGVLIALVAWVWLDNGYLGLVVGAALALNTMIAVTLGGVLPLALKFFKLDPALASGPILTTVTDMCGFFIALTLAAWMLPLL